MPIEYHLATQADDPDLRHLLRENPFPGRIQVTFEREPNFFLAAPIWFLRKVTGARARGRPREEVRSDFGLAPEPLEEILFLLLSLEARLLGAGVNQPFGVSAHVVAERPGPGQGTSEEAK